ncbi:MAG: type II toxin-antitoxin system PemK/MazF family toxin [Candidatus Kariarchaeaceae archaeon]
MNTTRFGTPYNQGDIVLVPFPFSDLSGHKKRPVLIISIDNQIDNDVISCVITSNPRKVNHSIIIDSGDLKTGSLPLQSKIRVNKIFTLEKSIILKKIGTLDDKTLNRVKNTFRSLV